MMKKMARNDNLSHFFKLVNVLTKRRVLYGSGTFVES